MYVLTGSLTNACSKIVSTYETLFIHKFFNMLDPSPIELNCSFQKLHTYVGRYDHSYRVLRMYYSECLYIHTST